MSDRIVAPLSRMRTFARTSSGMAAEVRSRASDLDAALDRVRTTTDPGYRPLVFGDGTDVQRWCEAVDELDSWVADVADLFASLDDPAPLLEALLLPLAGAPDLPVADGDVAGLARLFGLPSIPQDQTIEEFDTIRTLLADRPALVGPWLDALAPDQRQRLYDDRWAALIALDGLSSRHLAGVRAAARANVPRWRTWEQVSQEYGWGFLSIGTQLKVERLLEYDGDVFLTIGISDSIAGKLDESLTGSLVEAKVGGTTTYQLTMAFDSMEELEATLDDIDEALLPGNPDVPWWAPGPRQSIEFSAQTERELAQRLEDHRDHVVGDVRSLGLTQDLEVLDGLFSAGGSQQVGVDRNTGNTVVSGEIRTGLAPGAVLPREVTIRAGDVQAAHRDAVELAPDGEVVSRTTTTTFAAEAGAVELKTSRGGVTFGTDHGTEVVHTVTTDADGRRTEMVVLADTEVERFGFSLAPDPRYPRATLAYESGEATTTHVYVRGDDGDWVEVTP